MTLAFLTVEAARQAGKQARGAIAASATLSSESSNVAISAQFDIFLSHSILDADAILGVKRILESQGSSVYVDWINDQQLDRESVTPQTAATLRTRMRACRSLIVATSENATRSRWIPWELGYFDALRGDKIAILPLVASEGAGFKGQEYLGLYPLIKLHSVDGHMYVLDQHQRRVAALSSFAGPKPTAYRSF